LLIPLLLSGHRVAQRTIRWLALARKIVGRPESLGLSVVWMDEMTSEQLANLIDAHAAALVLCARAHCSTPEDVVQEAFCKLLAQVVPPADPVAWLHRVVRNRALDCGKAERRRSRREAQVARREVWFTEPTVEGLDAERAVQALQSLPEEQREVVIARLWGGRTLEQIAATVGCSVSTAYRRYESALVALREMLGESCPNHPIPSKNSVASPSPRER
jgi:RNA polymerase sigma factor (sigma-70 family)